ncbi:MAG: DNA translocase FtsK 4TM domain-containing protein, partial [Desulfobacterales bacterium]|nr:DNA translocase FtsK 4TM domain-containing protein [Desulfobacterales bacterium]
MIEDSIKEKLRHEIVGILLIALGVFLFISLISYHPMDPSFFSYTSAKVKGIHNWMGIVGAYLSGLLFQSFGFPSFLISFVLVFFAFSFVFRWEWEYLSLKIAGWAVLLISISSFFGLWLSPIRIYSQDLLMGGFIGEIFSRNLVRYFNRPGATVLLLMILILSFVLGTGISFISLVKHLGEALQKLIGKIGTFKMVRREGAEREKKLVKQKQEKKEAKEIPPTVVIEKPSLPSKREEEMKQEAFEFLESSKAFQLPPISLLEAEVEKRQKIDRESLIMNSRILEKKLLDYGVEGKVVEVRPGPVITVY